MRAAARSARTATAASLLSAAEVPIEDISHTLGRGSFKVTAGIYRHPMAPVPAGHIVATNQLIETMGAKTERRVIQKAPDRDG